MSKQGGTKTKVSGKRPTKGKVGHQGETCEMLSCPGKNQLSCQIQSKIGMRAKDDGDAPTTHALRSTNALNLIKA